MAEIVEAELPAAPLLLTVSVELGLPHDGHWLAIEAQCDRRHAFQFVLILRGNRQHNRNGLIGHFRGAVQKTAKMLTLKENVKIKPKL
jgi:hypothetical protein